MSSLFTKIINQEIPSFKLAEDDRFYAFLDIRPISPGHALVIPKAEIDHFFELPDLYLSEIMVFAKPLVKAIEASVECLRVGAMIAGLEVPHAHLHLVPIQSMQTFSFAHARAAEPADLEAMQARILAALKKPV